MPSLIAISNFYQKKLKICLVIYVGVFLCMYKPGISAGPKCGRPGQTASTFYDPSGSSFNESDVIRYKCKNKDEVIFDISERRCQRDGTWSDDLPVCSKLAKFEVIELYQESEEGINRTVDGNITTCTDILDDNQIIWRGFSFSPINISAVRISFLGKGPVDIDITIQDDFGQRNCDTKRENSEITLKSIRLLTFYCPENTLGKYVHVTINTQALRICEVAVLLPPSAACLAPDRPLHGNGLRRTSIFKFTCDTGYKLWGNITTNCKTDGRWSTKTPKCQEIYCTVPDTFENGYIQNPSNKAIIPYNGTITYFCKEGFSLSGESINRCHKWEEWIYPQPVCKSKSRSMLDFENIPNTDTWRQSHAAHCDNLPHIANGTLIVNSSNSVSTAWLKCDEGFKPMTEHYISCLATGEWSSQSLHCKPIECDVNPIVPHGRAILLNNSAYYGAHLEIKCNDGFTSQNPITPKCNEFGTWGDLNVCVEIMCESFTKNENTEVHWLVLNGSSYMRVLICPEYYHIEGSPAVIQCLLNGSWSYTSAKCQRSSSVWGRNWTPTLILVVAIGAGAGTAILILCLSAIFLVIRKRQQTQTNTTVFHLEDTSQFVGVGRIHRHKHLSAVENFEDMVERRPQSICTNPRKPCSALPNLPVDADPVYAQPFEIVTETKKSSNNPINKKSNDLYNTHIYAEPVDSRRQVPSSLPVCVSIPRIRTDTNVSTIKTNSAQERMTSSSAEQNCDKWCAIYDSSSNSILNSGRFTTDGKYQSYKENPESGTLAKNLEYMELL